MPIDGAASRIHTKDDSAGESAKGHSSKVVYTERMYLILSTKQAKRNPRKKEIKVINVTNKKELKRKLVKSLFAITLA